MKRKLFIPILSILVLVAITAGFKFSPPLPYPEIERYRLTVNRHIDHMTRDIQKFVNPFSHRILKHNPASDIYHRLTRNRIYHPRGIDLKTQRIIDSLNHFRLHKNPHFQTQTLHRLYHQRIFPNNHLQSQIHHQILQSRINQMQMRFGQ